MYAAKGDSKGGTEKDGEQQGGRFPLSRHPRKSEGKGDWQNTRIELEVTC